MHGVLVIDKPAGPTSHDVVARVRRATVVRKIGHTGTLDPMATGVLPLVMGRATRLAQFFAGREKVYEAEIRFGGSTDTYDRTGRFSRPDSHTDPPVGRLVDRAAINAALDGFRGTFLQTPPAVSAKKIGGVRAYRLARAEAAVELAPVSVTVCQLDVLSFDPGSSSTTDTEADPRLRIRIVCSAGFYVRALAHDLGARLGCGAWLETLRRVQSGDFSLSAAVALETVEQEGPTALRRIVPIEELLRSIPGVVLNEAGVRRARHGNEVTVDHLVPASAGALSSPPRSKVRLLDEQGGVIAIAERAQAGATLHPVVVLV